LQVSNYFWGTSTVRNKHWNDASSSDLLTLTLT